MNNAYGKSSAVKIRSGRNLKFIVLAICLFAVTVLGGCGAKDNVPGQQASALPAQPTRYPSAKAETEPPEKEYLYTFFENGSLSSKTGETSNSNKNPIRSKQYIAVQDFIKAKLRDGYYIRVFAYDHTFSFLGAINNKTRIDQQMVTSRYPLCEYIRILAISKDGAQMDPSSIEKYSLTVCLKSEYMDPDADIAETADGFFLYSLFENGNISSKTGEIGNANKDPIRSVHYLPVHDFINVKIRSGYYVRVFAYDGEYAFLGAINNKTSIDYPMIISQYPACAYIKVLATSRDGEALASGSIDEYGLSVLLSAEYPKKNRSLDKDDIAEFASDGAINRSFEVYIDPQEAPKQALIITCTAKYTDGNSEEYPTIQFRIVNDADKSLYYSPVYRIAEKNGPKEKQWRVPPCQEGYGRIKISVTVPEGIALVIDDLRSEPDTGLVGDDGGILFHAHQGFSGLCGTSTPYAFRMAGEIGYRSCITIPKFTSDGVCVCFHDDGSIRDRLRYPDGSLIAEGSEDDKKITEFTYEDLMRFDVGIRKNRIYAGAKVPTLDEFFSTCAQYGMAPVLTIHSSSDWWGEKGIAHFTYIREMAEKYGILAKLRIKSGNNDVQRTARTVFDHDIAGYILLQAQTSTWDPLRIAKRSGFVASDAASMDESDYFVVMEYFYAAATDEKIRLAMEEGFPVSIATTGSGISGPELERLMDLGVTEFTIDHHCSMGLNW